MGDKDMPLVIVLFISAIFATFRFYTRRKTDQLCCVISYYAFFYTFIQTLSCTLFHKVNSFFTTFFGICIIISVVEIIIPIIFRKIFQQKRDLKVVHKIAKIHEETLAGFAVIGVIVCSFLNLEAYELAIIIFILGFGLNCIFHLLLKEKAVSELNVLQDIAYLFSALFCFIILGLDVAISGADMMMFMTLSVWIILMVLYAFHLLDQNEGTTFWCLEANIAEIRQVGFRRKRMLKRVINVILPFGLIMFSLFIENTIDFYYANKSILEFKVADFWGVMIVQAIALSVLVALFMSCMSANITKVFASICFGIALASYIQVMLFNRDIRITDTQTIDSTVYHSKLIINSLVWAICILTPFVLFILFKKKIFTWISYLSGALIMIQFVAAIFLLVKCGGYHNIEGVRPVDYYISSENEYTISSNKNIIVFILDTFSNDFFDFMIDKYPDAMENYKDFTYYNNYSSKYDGTALALNYLLTGIEFDNSVPCREYAKNAYESDKTQMFYKYLHAEGYTCNIYTDNETSAYIGKENLYGLYDNVVREYNVKTIIDRKKVRNNIFRGALYKCAPLVLKEHIPVVTKDFENLVKVVGREDELLKLDDEFFAELNETGLNTNTVTGNFKIYHFQGMHNYGSGEVGTEEEIADAAYQNFQDVYCYIEKLKELKLYDDTTIIILGDHGKWWTTDGIQPIFLIKEADTQHSEMFVSDAPISAEEFMPTVLNILDIDNNSYGKTIYDYSEGEIRDRTEYVRQFADFSGTFTIDTNTNNLSSFSALYGYNYQGDKEVLRRSDVDNPDIIMPLIDFWH